MRIGLYLYCDEKLESLMNQLQDYSFYDIAYFLDICNTVEAVKMLDKSEYNKIVIDISDIIQEAMYYRIFTAQYIRALGKLNDVAFCMRKELISILKMKFPFLFFQCDIDKSFSEQDFHEPLQIDPSVIKQLRLFTYENVDNIEQNENQSIISFSDVIDEWNNLSIQYDISAIEKTIEKNHIKYIDISSTIQTLRFRHDLILPIEVMLHRIGRICAVDFCMNSLHLSESKEIFPFLFQSITGFEENHTEMHSDSSSEINIYETETHIEDICQKLKGHDNFKADLRNNILKHQFLNQMEERKILSIMICGESGIGKTEFAKIASEVLFPGEPLIKINFGNYSTEGVLNSLIGSPLGYVGSQEGGELINKIKSSKSKVILIDEFEKATASVYNFFYELLEDGLFTDRHGESHDLKGYIIVFTSNMSQQQYQNHIPDSLKSRFDMVYYFVDVPLDEKKEYIDVTALKIIEKLNNQFGVCISKINLDNDLYKLLELHNLREIKRKIENIIFEEFFRQYKKSDHLL